MSVIQRSSWDDELFSLIDPAAAAVLKRLPSDLSATGVRLLLDYCAQRGVGAAGQEDAATAIVSADFRPVLENERQLNIRLAARNRP